MAAQICCSQPAGPHPAQPLCPSLHLPLCSTTLFFLFAQGRASVTSTQASTEHPEVLPHPCTHSAAAFTLAAFFIALSACPRPQTAPPALLGCTKCHLLLTLLSLQPRHTPCQGPATIRSHPGQRWWGLSEQLAQPNLSMPKVKPAPLATAAPHCTAPKHPPKPTKRPKLLCLL